MNTAVQDEHAAKLPNSEFNIQRIENLLILYCLRFLVTLDLSGWFFNLQQPNKHQLN